MRRYTNWSLVFFIGLLSVVAVSSGYWIPEVQPYLVKEAEVIRFDCPRFVSSNQCGALRELARTNLELAEQLRDALDPENDLEVLNEPELNAWARDLNTNTSDEPVITTVKTGSFNAIDVIRETEGVVRLYEIIAGDVVGRLLRFEDQFKTINGPDFEIYLTTASNPRTAETLLATNPLKVALLKGNVGSQNYEVGLDLDLTVYQSVVIYSESLDLIIAVASLATN